MSPRPRGLRKGIITVFVALMAFTGYEPALAAPAAQTPAATTIADATDGDRVEAQHHRRRKCRRRHRPRRCRRIPRVHRPAAALR